MSVDIEPLRDESDLPLLIQPATPGLNLGSWAKDHHDLVLDSLRKHGGILFRGFSLSTAEEFEDTVRSISGDLLEYRERSSPRSMVSGKVYTSTDYPPDQPIFLHNENSYQYTWPRLIFFFCHTEPEKRGETPIADCRRVFERIDPEIRERFREKKWMYVRNFGTGLGLDWQNVFQTEDRGAIEKYCADNEIEFEWHGDQLRTRAVRPAITQHPDSEDMLWFNHATFFHVSTLPEEIREVLLEVLEEEDLPSNTYYGDGSPIERETLDHLRGVYEAETVIFPWRQGDLLMLDNMMVAHGRMPFEGQRKILVAMAHPCDWGEVAG